MKVYCVFSLESPQRGVSYEYTQHTFLNIEKKIILNHHKFASMGSFPRDQKRVRNSRGEQAIRVRAIEVRLYLIFKFEGRLRDYRNLSSNLKVRIQRLS